MTVLPFFEFSLYQMFLIFCFWSFVGWGIEVCYMTLETGEYQNRGFFNMPFCPIYGVGVILVVTLLRPIQHTIILLFVTSSLVCTVFELAVGLAMEKIFHNRWWDYSHERFNYKGLICLSHSIYWGLGCTFVLRVIQPIVVKGIDFMPVPAGLVFIVIMSILFIVDFIVSVSTVAHLNERLKQIDELSNLLIKNSILIGSNISEETLEIKARYDKLVNNLDSATKRIIKAFPNIRSVTYTDAMEMLKGKINSNAVVDKIKTGISKINQKSTK